MTVAEMVFEEVKRLPEPVAREVLDFVEALAERQDAQSWRDLMLAQSTGLASTWDNSDDDVWNDA